MIVTLYKNLLETRAVMKDVTWQEFISDPGNTEPIYVDGATTKEQIERRAQLVPLYSPAELRPGTTRANENVLRLHFATFDLDDRTSEEVVGIINNLKARGQAFFVHTTFSHAICHADYLREFAEWQQAGGPASGLPAPVQKNCLRLIVPLSRPVPAAVWKATWSQLNKIFALGANDKQVNDASRAYFAICAPAGTDPSIPFTYSQDGAPIDVDALEIEATTVVQLPGEKLTVQDVTEKLDELKKKPKLAKFRKLLTKLRAGQALGGDGERHEETRYLSFMMVQAWPDASADSILDLFKPSIQAMQLEGGEIDEDEVRNLIVGAQQKREETRISQENEAVTEARLSIERSIGRTTPYTYQELLSFAQDSGVSLERFKKHWIIQHNEHFFLYVNGQYRSRAFSKAELIPAARDLLAPASSGGVDLRRVNEKGNFVPKTNQELVLEYGLVTEVVVYDLIGQRSYFDPVKSTLTLCTARRDPDIVARFVPEVDVYLRILGGPKQNKLLDWCATSTRQDEPNSTLFLKGAVGAGKSLLAIGMSRIWTPNGPVKLAVAIDSDFNADMLRCPLIFGDEEMPRDQRGRAKTTELRALVTEPTHRLRAKFRDDTILRGHPRIILAANNDEQLRTSESLTNDDIEAISKRILTIDVSQYAKQYMESLTHEQRKFLLDNIAPHILWLAENRVVARGTRFLVDGDDDAARSMVVSAGLRGPVLHWCASYLMRPNEIDAFQRQKYNGGKLIRVRGGKLLISTPALLENWSSISTNAKPPTMRELSAALKGISERERVQLRCGNGRKPEYWVIDRDNLQNWCVQNAFCSIDELNDWLARKEEDPNEDEGAPLPPPSTRGAHAPN